MRKVPVADHVVKYAIRLVRQTLAQNQPETPKFIKDYVSWGAGPRSEADAGACGEGAGSFCRGGIM